MAAKSEVALKFLLKAYERKRRHPVLRYFWPDWTPSLIGLVLLVFVFVFLAAVGPKYMTPTMSILSIGTAVYVWWKGSFRTRNDERSEFIVSAEKIGVSEIAAGDFYDVHAKKGRLM